MIREGEEHTEREARFRELYRAMHTTDPPPQVTAAGIDGAWIYDVDTVEEAEARELVEMRRIETLRRLDDAELSTVDLLLAAGALVVWCGAVGAAGWWIGVPAVEAAIGLGGEVTVAWHSVALGLLVLGVVLFAYRFGRRPIAALLGPSRAWLAHGYFLRAARPPGLTTLRGPVDLRSIAVLLWSGLPFGVGLLWLGFGLTAAAAVTFESPAIDPGYRWLLSASIYFSTARDWAELLFGVTPPGKRRKERNGRAWVESMRARVAAKA